MKINKIIAENFMSYERFELNFSNNLTLINGYDYDTGLPEGSGKSSILDAVCYSIFGDTPRKVKVDNLINRISKKNMSVVIELTDGNNEYKIERTRKPNNLLFYKNNELNNGKDYSETQSIIEKEFGINLDIFLKSIYFAQNQSQFFVTANDRDKKELLTTLLRLDKIDEISEKIKTKRKKLKEQMTLIENDKGKCDYRASFLSGDKLGIQQLKTEQDKKIATIDEKIKQIKDAIGELNNKKINTSSDILESISEIDVQLKKLEKIREELSDKALEIKPVDTNNLNNVKRQVSEQEAYIKRLKEGSGTCKYCNATINEDTKARHLKEADEKLEELQVRYSEAWTDVEQEERKRKDEKNAIADEKKKCSEQIEELEGKKRAIKEGINKINISNQKLDNEINNLKLEIAKLEGFIPVDYDAQIKKIDDEIKSLSEEILKIEKKKQAVLSLDSYLVFLENMFSNSGLKTYIFSQVIEEINTVVRNNLTILFNEDISLEFNCDNTTDKKGNINNKFETILTLDGKNIEFENLSGGEKRRIILAVDLALSEVIQNRMGSINLLMIDEYFSGLSLASKEKIIDLLNKLKENKSIYVIDHDELLYNKFDNNITISKKGGISEIN